MAKERSIKLEGSEALNSGRFLPAGLRTLVLKDWSMAPGISVGSGGTGKFGYVLSMRKLPQVSGRVLRKGCQTLTDGSGVCMIVERCFRLA